ncbi:heterochromatin protein 1-like [Actinia tenebrosa]|uniref:Heterochromatin protein 1-like n=1 Tax=Actinia tenebrosa TaxID=6105 RepID=A0A6P8IQY9_ACTTE|nr:heterochromatin protein 1-like [Actinia tenebrosa]
MATDIDDDEVFEVKTILKRRMNNGMVEYLVSWKGFGPEDNTWEPEKNLNGCRALLRDYLRSMKPKDFSPKTTRRRTINLPTTNAKENDFFTRIKSPGRKAQPKVLHMKEPPPPSPLGPKTNKTRIFEEEKTSIQEEKQSVTRTITRKQTKVQNSEQPVQINSNGLRTFVFLALFLFFVILLAFFFKPVETR